jgi:hypothetical protein
MIRKVGGICFWNIGRVGGSFYVAKRKQPRLRLASDALIATLVAADVVIWGALIFI